MANTYTQIYIHIVFAVEGRQNLINWNTTTSCKNSLPALLPGKEYVAPTGLEILLDLVSTKMPLLTELFGVRETRALPVFDCPSLATAR